MSELKEYLSKNCHTELLSVSYEIKGDSAGSSKVMLEDEFKVELKEKRTICITFSRHIFMKPEAVMDIRVSAFIEHYLDPEKLEKVDFEGLDIEKEIKKDLDYYIRDGYARISQVISQLTSSFGNSPLITPPFYMED